MLDSQFERARDRWWRDLPKEIRDTSICRADLEQLLRFAHGFLDHGSPESLAELEVASYRLARSMESRWGRDGMLRWLRDGLVCALASSRAPADLDAERLGRLVGRVSDAAWSAHGELLEATVQQSQQERIQQELRLAKRIQEQLLPRDVPTVPGYDIAGRVLPAEAIGGDYWSCRSYPEDGIVTFKLADITGHGVAAATLVAAVKFISGGYYRGAKTAALVMERTNTVLVRETPHEVLVTMVYGWLYPFSNEMSVVNAGHSPVLHWHDGRVRTIPPTGVALALMETRYREVRLEMALGDVFLTCSDGVTAPDAQHALGEDWVRDRLQELHQQPAAEIVAEIITRALAEYGSPLDDMSVLVVKRTD
ncbi:MAG: PP2C family protein-serine/threonine phosphatase [Actinomycetota bacterium]